MIRYALAAIFGLFALACSDHGHAESDFLSRSVTVNGNTYNYRVYIPANRDPDTKVKIPVMLYLHGSGLRGDDNRSQIGSFPSFIREHPEYFQFIMVLPQCRRDTFWAGEMTDQAMAALDQTVKEFNGDETRLYLAGYSMGAYGTWQTAITYPNKFAALVRVAGGILPLGEVSPDQKANLSSRFRAVADSDDPHGEFAAAIGKTPVWVFHGDKDDAVPVEGSRKIVQALRAAGNPSVNYTEFANVGHDSIRPAFAEPQLFEWLARQCLNLQP